MKFRDKEGGSKTLAQHCLREQVVWERRVSWEEDLV